MLKNTERITMKAKKIIRVLVVSFFLLSGCLKEKGDRQVDFKMIVKSSEIQGSICQFESMQDTLIIKVTGLTLLISKTSSKFEE